MFFSETPNETTMCETLNERQQQPCETHNERLQQPCETPNERLQQFCETPNERLQQPCKTPNERLQQPCKTSNKRLQQPMEEHISIKTTCYETHFLQAWTDIYIYKSASDKMPVFSDHFFVILKMIFWEGFCSIHLSLIT